MILYLHLVVERGNHKRDANKDKDEDGKEEKKKKKKKKMKQIQSQILCSGSEEEEEDPASLEREAGELYRRLGFSTQSSVSLQAVSAFENGLGCKIVVFYYDDEEEGAGKLVPYETGSSGGDGESGTRPTVYLFLHRGHYFGIKNVSGFLGYKNFCRFCLKGYVERHQCALGCSVCSGGPCPNTEKLRFCADCNRTCRSEECYARHKDQMWRPRASRYASLCELNKKCSLCGMVYYVGLIKRTPHRCPSFKCQPLLPTGEFPLKHVYYDFGDYVFIAHNAKGYDNYLLLSYLVSQKALGFPVEKEHLHKGYFPYLFASEEKLSYVGPYPPPSDYGCSEMSPSERDRFLRWYETVRRGRFDFAWEMRAYCRNNVAILREACLTFRTQIIEDCGIDPFTCISLPALSLKIFRTNHLSKNALTIPCPFGYERQFKSWSHGSVEWMSYLEAKNPGLSIRHALKGGEVTRFKPYVVDGYADGGKGGSRGETVFEYLGCFHHGCPECFRARDVWNALKRGEGGDPSVAAFLASYEEPSPPFHHRAALYGGDTSAIRLRYSAPAEGGERVRYADFNSLYPACMADEKKLFLTGPPVVLYSGFDAASEDPIASYFGLVQAKVYRPRGLFFPLLPYKTVKGGITSWNLRRPVLNPFYEELKRELDNITFVKGLPELLTDERLFPEGCDNLLILDDVLSSTTGSSSSSDQVLMLFTDLTHHRRLSSFYLTLNIFHRGKHSRTISLNCHYMILFKNLRDKLQLRVLAGQMYPGNTRFLLE
ncbi:hypothetical protein ACEWY4_019319 [Coilia grayii]|uniref:DNA-directed DNA polymerase n=1 Tax=Coilia grayii TaxID=363190 RepID=A0ABD1JFQ5_9TELE